MDGQLLVWCGKQLLLIEEQLKIKPQTFSPDLLILRVQVECCISPPLQILVLQFHPLQLKQRTCDLVLHLKHLRFVGHDSYTSNVNAHRVYAVVQSYCMLG